MKSLIGDFYDAGTPYWVILRVRAQREKNKTKQNHHVGRDSRNIYIS